MAGDRDKLHVLLERAKVLKEEERWTINIGLALLAAFATIAKLMADRILSIMILVTGLLVAAGVTITSIRVRREAETLWGKLVKDPGDRLAEVGRLLLYAGIIAFALIMLVATLLGAW